MTAVLAAGFTWGYFAHRNRVFPYRPLHAVATAVGVAPAATSHEPWNGGAAAGLDALASFPYVAGTMDPHADRSGVLVHDEERAFRGWNLFSPRAHPRAFLVDMDGRVVHRWRAESGPWQHVTLLPGGGLLALVKDRELIRLDRDSRVLWRCPGAFHHDLSVDAAGRIYALARRNELRPEIHPRRPTVVDRLIVLSADGELLREVSLLDLLLGSPYAFLLPDLHALPDGGESSPIDVLHSNHVEVFGGRLAQRLPLYRAGNVLLSMRTLSSVFIVDPAAGRVLWAWGPSNLAFQHDPTLLDDGHLLIFNNGTRRSEVVELDPLERRVVWRYRADDFFSRTRGSVQRLANGNTLITESDSGYAFEVTPDGERVWVFASPFFTPAGERMAVWRLRRFAAGDPRLTGVVE